MKSRRSVSELRFALGDYADTIFHPLGIATDVRWVWHEFCHALLVASTGELEFPFAHSAGDALAAINGDPGSRYPIGNPLRGVTFPFIATIRRHDRKVEDGWGWHGTFYLVDDYPSALDPAGYIAEQILSSTLFRLYASLVLLLRFSPSR
jgi:hypothetical protein